MFAQWIPPRADCWWFIPICIDLFFHISIHLHRVNKITYTHNVEYYYFCWCDFD